MTDQPGQQGQPPDLPAWDRFVESLSSLPQRLLARLPEAAAADPLIRQEVCRLALESLASSTLSALGSDGDAPQFLPALNHVLNVGQPNADTIYRSCRITPGGHYRLRGRRGSLALAVISQVIPRDAPGATARAHLNLTDLATDGEGRFDVIVSPDRPAGHAGDWWPLNPAATQLMIRMVSADWAGEQAPSLAIERIDRPVGRPRLSAQRLEAMVDALPASVDFLALMLVDHAFRLREEGYVNRFKVLTLEFGALDGQFYYEAAFDLAEDEALIVESPIPARCDYRSLILTNEIYETIDWYNNHSSLNGAQAGADPDGWLRIVVSARDPGVANWLDTAGHPRGIIQGRWTGCDSQPMPTARKVRVDEVLAHLPAGVARVTPDERQAIVRARRAAYLQRPMW